MWGVLEGLIWQPPVLTLFTDCLWHTGYLNVRWLTCLATRTNSGLWLSLTSCIIYQDQVCRCVTCSSCPQITYFFLTFVLFWNSFYYTSSCEKKSTLVNSFIDILCHVTFRIRSFFIALKILVFTACVTPIYTICILYISWLCKLVWSLFKLCCFCVAHYINCLFSLTIHTYFIKLTYQWFGHTSLNIYFHCFEEIW